jgi:hypothetical protein
MKSALKISAKRPLKKYEKGGKLKSQARNKKYQNGGTLNTLSGIAGAAGGIASAIPGIGTILGTALSSAVAPVLGMLAAKQQKRDSINQLYSNISIMEKGGPIDPPYVYESPAATVTASRLPKGYSKMSKEDQARYDRFMKSKRPASGQLKSLEGFDDPIFNLMGMPGAIRGAKTVVRRVVKDIKQIDPSKLNPNRFRPNPDMMYRGIGEGGFKDAVESGLFRSKQIDLPKGEGRVVLQKSFKSSGPYFTPYFRKAKGYGAKYIAEVPKSSAKWSQRYKKSDWSQWADRNIPVKEGKILKKDWWKGYKEVELPEKEKGGLIKRKDGSYSKRGLWDNLRSKAAENKRTGAKPKAPTKQMLEQERKIKASKEFGGTITGNSDLSFYKGKSHRDGGIMVNSKGVPSRNASAEVEGGETRFMYKDKAYIFSDKLTI